MKHIFKELWLYPVLFVVAFLSPIHGQANDEFADIILDPLYVDNWVNSPQNVNIKVDPNTDMLSRKLWPRQVLEITRRRTPVYFAKSIAKNASLNPAFYLERGSVVLPCIYMVNGTKPLRHPRSKKILLGFIANPHDNMTRSKNHHCPSHIKHVVDPKNLVKYVNIEKEKPIEGKSTNTPAIKKWVVKKFEKLQQDVFDKNYYKKATPDDLAHEFHNTLCKEVNTKARYRAHRIKKLWDQFIEERGKISKVAAQKATVAKHLDLATRTTIYESNWGDGCNATADCERQIIALTIYNRGISQSCRNGSKTLGCKHKGDFAGVSTQPRQYNIWFDQFARNSFLTTCFLREDLQSGVKNPARWKDQSDRRGYLKRIRMYKDTFGFIEDMFYGNINIGDYLTETKDETLERKNRLGDLKNYYHPMAMTVCHQPTYSKSAWVFTAYAKKDDSNYSMIRRTRIFPKGTRKESRIPFRLYNTTNGSKPDRYPGGTLAHKDIDYTHNFACTPGGVSLKCNSRSRDRKLPLWHGKSPRILCRKAISRGLACDEAPREEVITMGGVCSERFMPVKGVDNSAIALPSAIKGSDYYYNP